MIIPKNTGYSGYYTVSIIGEATDWTGSMSLYNNGANGIPTATFPLTFETDRLTFTILPTQAQELESGLYTAVVTITSQYLGISVQRVDYASVSTIVVNDNQPMTTITMTIAKIDGTPAGKEIKTLTNTVDGAVITLGWDGVQVTAAHTVADQISGAIIGIETITTKTNAAGYAQLAVIKGSTVTISCPSFGKSVTVDTTGQDSIDLSSYF